MSEKVIIFDGKLKLESIGGCKRAVICFVAQAPSVTLEYEQAVCVVLDQEGQEQKAREIGAHFAKWGRVVMTFEPEDAMSEHADFVYSDFGEDGKNKSGLDAEKIRVVCARCQSTVNAKISYVAATDWFYVTVRFFWVGMHQDRLWAKGACGEPLRASF